MKKYLVLYRAPVSADEQMAAGSAEDAQAGMEAWMTWAGKAGAAIVDLGSPLSEVASVGGSGDNGQFIGGFSILQAESGDELKNVLDGHPHLQMPGDASIQVLEFLPIPGS